MGQNPLSSWNPVIIKTMEAYELMYICMGLQVFVFLCTLCSLEDKGPKNQT
jgi:hypothetical protein